MNGYGNSMGKLATLFWGSIYVVVWNVDVLAAVIGFLEEKNIRFMFR